MKGKVEEILNDLMVRYPKLEGSKKDIISVFEILKSTYINKKKVLVVGNGGSAADAEHIVGELMKGFAKRRPLPDELKDSLCGVDYELGKELGEKLQVGLPTISLVGHPSLSTAYLNDVDSVLGFAQQVNGFGETGDTLFTITTSGNSKNIIYSAVVAKAKGMKVISLTGKDGGRVKEYADGCIVVEEQETYKIQELHLPIYHALCLMLEEEFFEK